jgi:hypothetical protein
MFWYAILCIAFGAAGGFSLCALLVIRKRELDRRPER